MAVRARLMIMKVHHKKLHSLVPWTLAAVFFATTVALCVYSIFQSNSNTSVMLDFLAKLLAPLGASLIAWTGVSLTVSNVQRQDRIKEWHNDLRWAVELSTSGNETAVLTGTNVLAAIEDLPFLTPDQNVLIDAVLMTGFARYDETSERSSDDCE